MLRIILVQPDISEVSEAASVTRAQVSAHPVVVEAVIVGAGAERDTTAARGRCREQFVAFGRVHRHRIVVNLHEAVKAIGQLRIRGQANIALARARSRVDRTRQVCIRMFSLANGDTAGQGSLVIANSVIGDFQVMCPAVSEDAATTLRTVTDGQAVNTRRVAHEVAGKAAVGAAASQQGRIVWERIRRERIRAETYALRQYGDARSFIGAHQSWLLQLLRQVAVQRGIPAHSGFQRQAINLRIDSSGVETAS